MTPDRADPPTEGPLQTETARPGGDNGDRRRRIAEAALLMWIAGVFILYLMQFGSIIPAVLRLVLPL